MGTDKEGIEHLSNHENGSGCSQIIVSFSTVILLLKAASEASINCIKKRADLRGPQPDIFVHR